MKSLTRDEIRRLLVCIDDKRDRLLIQLGLALGCRVSEVVTLELGNILPDRIIVIDRKKQSRLRECVIDSDTRALLDDYLRASWEDERPRKPKLLFYFSYKTANRVVKRWFKAAAIPDDKAHWHTLRHTYVVQSLEAGVPLNHVCEQTGDSPETVIKVYGRPSIDARRQMIERTAYWRN